MTCSDGSRRGGAQVGEATPVQENDLGLPGRPVEQDHQAVVRRSPQLGVCGKARGDLDHVSGLLANIAVLDVDLPTGLLEEELPDGRDDGPPLGIGLEGSFHLGDEVDPAEGSLDLFPCEYAGHVDREANPWGLQPARFRALPGLNPGRRDDAAVPCGA